MSMQLHKTDRARAELKSGTRTLGQRERTLLLLADGSRSVHDFRPLFNGDGEQIALRLMREGFLQARPGAVTTPPAPSMIAVDKPPSVDTERRPPPPRQPAPQAAARVSADQFEGKRSLATTRMFLFDICERMFARKNPELAGMFREALRDARDRETMLSTARRMIEEIEKVTGSERADSISERIAMLLPDEQLA
jgi:hypothetical protein